MSIKAVDLNYVYGNGTAFEQHALFDVNFEIQDGEVVGIIGHRFREIHLDPAPQWPDQGYFRGAVL